MPGYIQSFRDRVKAFYELAEKPAFSYVTIFLVQLKALWGIWIYKDLTFGDTSSYYSQSIRWYENFQVNLAWSPLYTAYYGSFQFFLTNAYTITMLHRLVIVFATTMLILCIMRRLLPWEIAWALAFWWAILPINYNTLYEVHLFSALPILAAWFVCLRTPTMLGSGIAVSILASSGLLVRNEQGVCAGLFLVVCLIIEYFRYRRLNKNETPPHTDEAPTLRSAILSYGIPLAIGIAVCAFFFWRNYLSKSDLQRVFHSKHSVNMGQVYAFGYQQRHPEWKLNPWIEYHSLLEENFGKNDVTLWEMLYANPNAVWEHFAWNYSLSPNGIQVLLFNETSGSINPDYAFVHLKQARALTFTLIWLAILVAGGYSIFRNFSSFWKEAFLCSWRGWTLILCVIPIYLLLVIPTQRPRPSYLFGVSAFLMALTGTCLCAILRAFFSKLAGLRIYFPFLVLISLLVLPCYFLRPQNQSTMDLQSIYMKLEPFQAIISDPRSNFVCGDFGEQIKSYVGRGKGKANSYQILAKKETNTSLGDYFDSGGINIFFFEASHMADFKTWVEIGPDGLPKPRDLGPTWQLLASHGGNQPWVLGYKPAAYQGAVKKGK